MQGYVDILSENGIHGWAHDRARPEERVTVLLVVQDRIVTTIRANTFRPDLNDAGLGDGRCAFCIDPIPWLSGENEAVRVAFATTGETLANGRGVLSISKVVHGEDWDRLRASATDIPPALERIHAHPPETWPLISVILPVFNTPIKFLDLAIKSVLGQSYPCWELCIADDGSTDRRLSPYLGELPARDPRIKVHFCECNRGISSATNTGFEMASGPFCALLDHDDELTLDALAEVAACLLERPDTDIIYTDQDKCDEENRLFEPFHKPDWSPVHFLGVMYVGHLLVARMSLVKQVGGCDSRFDKVQDFELMLRFSEVTTRIVHLPVVTYHWRTLAGSIAASTHAKTNIDTLQVAAVNAHLGRRKLDIRAVSHSSLAHRIAILPARDHSDTKVSVIIPTKDSPDLIGRCLDSLFGISSHGNFEVLVVDTGTTDKRALEALRSHPIHLLEDRRAFNFSRVNNLAARAATGEVLVFLNNDTEVVTPDWMQLMLAHLSLPGVGAVGPQLIYPDGTVQHAGVVLGLRGTFDHIMRGCRATNDGYAGSLACSREVSAVTAACLMMPRALYAEIGGMNEAFATIYQDMDLCLQIRETGHSILYVANAVLKHHESVSRGSKYDFVDRELILDRWGATIAHGDPYYNQNFTLNRHDYSLRSYL